VTYQHNHDPKLLAIVHERNLARIAGMDEAEIDRKFPRPKPPIGTRIRTLAKAGVQALRDMTRHQVNPVAKRDTIATRKAICNVCEHHRRGTCQKCGCLIPLKVHLARSTCPVGRWIPDPVSVLIPARNEQYLERTIQSLFETAIGPIDVWVFLDAWDDHLEVQERVLAMDNDRVHCVVNDAEPKGIRHGSNVLADLAQGVYLFRVDGHCNFSPGWDVPLKNAADPGTVVVPAMRILDVETWTAERGGGNFYYINRDYRYKVLPDAKTSADVVEIMAFIGAAWFCRRETWMNYGGYDEQFYHWGESGVEWSLKTWLNGGRLVLDRRAWFGHYFRPKFPYHLNGHAVQSNRTAIREHFQDFKGERSLAWLVKKFKPLPGWHTTKRKTPHGTK
tara:strand:- start:4401 stop:5573 length:1173 start_codon:yes stop_codon:yes gene_type:complete